MMPPINFFGFKLLYYKHDLGVDYLEFGANSRQISILIFYHTQLGGSVLELFLFQNHKQINSIIQFS